MKHYEMLYILPNQYSDDEAKAINEKINGLIKELGGAVTLNDNSLGRMKLAYPIKQVNQGIYSVTEFDAEPNTLRDLDKKLKAMTEIVRYQVVIKTEREKQVEVMRQKRLERQEKIKEEKIQEEAKPTAAATAKKSKKISLEELDEKLDEILSSTKDI